MLQAVKKIRRERWADGEEQKEKALHPSSKRERAERRYKPITTTLAPAPPATYYNAAA